MAIEVELKARVSEPGRVRAVLAERSSGEVSTYRDTYYDWPDRRLTGNGRQELRVRIIETAGRTRCLLTFKGAMLDEASTPEFETDVADAKAIDQILSALGLEHLIAYTKECENFRFDAAGHPIVATVVTVPEVDGTFIEIETLVPDGRPLDDGHRAIQGVLTDLGLSEDDLEPTFYIDMVAARRAEG